MKYFGGKKIGNLTFWNTYVHSNLVYYKHNGDDSPTKQTYVHLWQYLAHFLSEWETFQTRFVQKIKTHFVFSDFFLSKIVPFMRYVEKYCSRRTGQRWQYGACALHAGYLRLQTHTHTNVILIVFSIAKIVARTCLNVTLYVQCLPCSSALYSRISLTKSVMSRTAMIAHKHEFMKWVLIFRSERRKGPVERPAARVSSGPKLTHVHVEAVRSVQVLYLPDADSRLSVNSIHRQTSQTVSYWKQIRWGKFSQKHNYKIWINDGVY